MRDTNRITLIMTVLERIWLTKTVEPRHIGLCLRCRLSGGCYARGRRSRRCQERPALRRLNTSNSTRPQGCNQTGGSPSPRSSWRHLSCYWGLGKVRAILEGWRCDAAQVSFPPSGTSGDVWRCEAFRVRLGWDFLEQLGFEEARC